MPRRFPRPYRSEIVKAGETKTIWSFNVGDGVGFLSKIGNEFVGDDFDVSYAHLWIDGDLFEGKEIDRDIAPIDSPLELDPPIVVKREIKWEQHNGDTTDHVYKVLIDGAVYSKDELRRLLKKS